jgi:ParB family chromosome partitioning protein
MLHSLDQGAISAGHARALLAIADPDAQAALHEAMLRQDVSVRAAEAAVAYWKRHNTLPDGLSAAPLPEDAPADPPSARPTRTKPPFILALQEHLRAHLHPKITLNGTQEMGRVTVPYESTAQLHALLAMLGINPCDLPENGKPSNGAGIRIVTDQESCDPHENGEPSDAQA